MPKHLLAGPQTVIEYLGRYTHKVAISNHRICSIDEEKQTVTFNYKDYADKGLQKQMTLTAHESICKKVSAQQQSR